MSGSHHHLEPVTDIRRWSAEFVAACLEEQRKGGATADSDTRQQPQAPPAQLPRHHEVLLLPRDHGGRGYAVSRRVVTEHSTFLADVLEALEEEDTSPNVASTTGADADGGDVGELPGVVSLEHVDSASAVAVHFFAVWTHRRAAGYKASIVEVPTPALHRLKDLYDDSWDAEHLGQISRTSDTEDLVDFPTVRTCLAFASAIGAEAWRDLLASYVVFQLRRALRLSPKPEEIARRWLLGSTRQNGLGGGGGGGGGGDSTAASAGAAVGWNDADMKQALEWGAEATAGIFPRRVERPVDGAALEGELMQWNIVNDLGGALRGLDLGDDDDEVGLRSIAAAAAEDLAASSP